MIDILEYLKGLIESDKYLKTILGDRIYYYEPTENTNTDNIFYNFNPITDTPERLCF
ncbi:phage protein [Staphylococcus gallinarum]|uniref:Phage protein n=1 Tax=Staphylococcus gallinarum TaxID=1293 RepID=A0A380FEF0_STAGA|nr:phage protein [Staphylococcus gallinarum]